MMQPGRKFTTESGYRYGFNGKENDKDISEGGQDYGLRIYENRLGRFLSVDPLSSSYPYYTPYQFSSNSPIELVDIDGGEGAKLTQVVKDVSDFISNFFSFDSEIENINSGSSKIVAGVEKQIIGPWNAGEIFNSDNPDLVIGYRKADGYIQGITGVVEVNLGVQSISNKVQTVVEIPLIIKDISTTTIKKTATITTKSNVKPVSTPTPASPPPVTSTYNMSESVPEWKGPLDYTVLPEPRNVGPSKKFTRTQHKNIMEYNKKMNGGVLRDDETGQILNPAKQDKSGVPSDMNSAQLDHKKARKPKDKTKTPGSNSNLNASIRSKAGNIKKSNN